VTIDWKRTCADFEKERANDGQELYRALRTIVPGILKERGYEQDGLIIEDLAEVARETARDVQRLLIYQAGEVDLIKYASYLAFWFRKLQPLPRAWLPSPAGGTKKPVHDINERLSLYLMSAFLHQMCVREKISDAGKVPLAFEAFFRSTTYDYVVKSMRHRTFGPHHYVILGMLICQNIDLATKS
jgi:hypothetical protein